MRKKSINTSEENSSRLKELTEALHPTDVKFSVALDSKSDPEKAKEEAVHVLTGLQQYIDGNHSPDNLGKYFSKIESF